MSLHQQTEWHFIHSAVAACREAVISGFKESQPPLGILHLMPTESRDSLSWSAPLLGQWRLNPKIQSQIWTLLGKVEVDLFTFRQTPTIPCTPWCSMFTLTLCFFPLLIETNIRGWLYLLVALDMICRDDLANNSATHLANFPPLRSSIASRN